MYQCAICHQWVTYGVTHMCGGYQYPYYQAPTYTWWPHFTLEQVRQVVREELDRPKKKRTAVGKTDVNR